MSTEFQTYLKKEGIRHELTVPKTPEQNSVAERMNRTLVKGVRAMLADARLPHRFWAEALSTAVYRRNRSPAMAVKGITPSLDRRETKCETSESSPMYNICSCNK